MNNSELLDTLSQINKGIRKENRSLKNRLQSIYYDNLFLENEVIKYFNGYPLIPNERCGIWYCDPKKFVQTSYFKSTDGHTSQWDFSTRRLNFHLFPTLKEHGGIIIVDSTRRGKKIPDALSKTIPIWCAVINYLMLESAGKDFNTDEILFVPPETVSKTEYSSIIKKLPLLIEKARKLGIFNGKELYNSFEGKILRPIWVFPGSSILQTSTDLFTGEVLENSWQVPKGENIIPLILCTVSYQAQDGMDKRYGFTYVQGAADDHELWSCGLTPKMFWDNYQYLTDLTQTDEEMTQFVEQLVLSKQLQSTSVKDKLDGAFESLDEITKEFSLGKIMDNITIHDKLYKMLHEQYKFVVILSDNVELKLPNDQTNDLINIYKLQSGSKKSSKELRAKLPEICKEIKDRLHTDKRILVCCNSGTDMSIGILLTVLSRYYTENWEYVPEDTQLVTKTVITKHLSKLIARLHGRNVNPSRATLKSVNSFLM